MMLYLNIFFAGWAAFLVVICDARVVEHNPFAILEDEISIGTRQNTDDSPICGVPCAPDNCGGQSCLQKRSFIGDFAGYNRSDPSRHNAHHLQKRFLNRPRTAGTISTYLEQQSENAAITRICPSGSISGFSYCLQQDFAGAPLNDNSQYLAGTANTLLEGCTVLTVVSARAVYMCHFYEDINYWPVQYERPQQGFQVILNLIESGQGSTYAAGDALNPALFTNANDKTQAFIMTPRNRATLDDETSQAYPNEYNALTELLERLVPGITIQSPYNYMCVPTVTNPDEPNDPKNYENAYQGVALFEYDTNADNKGNADWRIWYETYKIRGKELGQIPVQA